jgi:hypothetical protein
MDVGHTRGNRSGWFHGRGCSRIVFFAIEATVRRDRVGGGVDLEDIAEVSVSPPFRVQNMIKHTDLGSTNDSDGKLRQGVLVFHDERSVSLESASRVSMTKA